MIKTNKKLKLSNLNIGSADAFNGFKLIVMEDDLTTKLLPISKKVAMELKRLGIASQG